MKRRDFLRLAGVALAGALAARIGVPLQVTDVDADAGLVEIKEAVPGTVPVSARAQPSIRGVRLMVRDVRTGCWVDLPGAANQINVVAPQRGAQVDIYEDRIRTWSHLAREGTTLSFDLELEDQGADLPALDDPLTLQLVFQGLGRLRLQGLLMYGFFYRTPAGQDMAELEFRTQGPVQFVREGEGEQDVS